MLLRVVRGGEPTAEEVAALVAAVTAVSAGSALSAGAGAARAGRGWGSRAARLRVPLHPGPGAWVASGRPH
ncbi:MAG: acyl-CoA carboxylase subunit epsilon [Frankiales bacterium]|nr:acyl-CoA carboxylase subunit epsilon [Frankiales bacterium]